ncbi:MAG: hypothetical protein ACE5D0_01575 [Fidelibacterota bacterium]
MNPILITTALQSEARPIIAFYKMVKRLKNNKFFYFQKDDIICLTTGVGAQNVRKRLSAFLKQTDYDYLTLINVGIAGGKRGIAEKGSMYLVSKIIDEKDKSVRITNTQLNNGLKKLHLTTVPQGIIDGGKNYNGLVDMEAAAIFDIATQSSSIQEMVFLKIVSDYMEEVLDSPEQVYPFINNQLHEIDRMITLCQNR